MHSYAACGGGAPAAPAGSMWGGIALLPHFAPLPRLPHYAPQRTTPYGATSNIALRDSTFSLGGTGRFGLATNASPPPPRTSPFSFATDRTRACSCTRNAHAFHPNLSPRAPPTTWLATSGNTATNSVPASTIPCTPHLPHFGCGHAYGGLPHAGGPPPPTTQPVCMPVRRLPAAQARLHTCLPFLLLLYRAVPLLSKKLHMP